MDTSVTLFSSESTEKNVLELNEPVTSVRIDRDEFVARFRASFMPVGRGVENKSISQLEKFAWRSYAANH